MKKNLIHAQPQGMDVGTPMRHNLQLAYANTIEDIVAGDHVGFYGRMLEDFQETGALEKASCLRFLQLPKRNRSLFFPPFATSPLISADESKNTHWPTER